MMKKTPVIVVVCCMLLLFSSLDVLALQLNGFGPGECCFSFYTKRLPKDGVVTFQRTGTRCVNNGVVFTMKNGGKFCVERTLDWVQNVIKHVQSRTSE